MIATGWLLFRQQTSLMLLPGGSSACKFLSRTPSCLFTRQTTCADI
jgi:hypothetical protein